MRPMTIGSAGNISATIATVGCDARPRGALLDPGEPSQLSGAAPSLGQYRYFGLRPARCRSA